MTTENQCSIYDLRQINLSQHPCSTVATINKNRVGVSLFPDSVGELCTLVLRNDKVGLPVDGSTPYKFSI